MKQVKTFQGPIEDVSSFKFKCAQCAHAYETQHHLEKHQRLRHSNATVAGASLSSSSSSSPRPSNATKTPPTAPPLTTSLNSDHKRISNYMKQSTELPLSLCVAVVNAVIATRGQSPPPKAQRRPGERGVCLCCRMLLSLLFVMNIFVFLKMALSHLHWANQLLTSNQVCDFIYLFTV